MVQFGRNLPWAVKRLILEADFPFRANEHRDAQVRRVTIYDLALSEARHENRLSLQHVARAFPWLGPDNNNRARFAD